MKPTVQPWLPSPGEGDVPAAITFMVERWLADWIAGPSRPTVARVDAPAGDGEWRGRRGAWCHAGIPATLALGDAASAGCADRDNPLDEQIARFIGGAMLDDLIVRLAGKSDQSGVSRMASAPADSTRPDDSAGLFRVVGNGDGWCVHLALNAPAIVQARKAVAGSSRQLELKPLTVALAGEAVKLGCHLGEAHLTVAEISALTIGDVIVLDRGLDGPVPFTVAGALPRGGSARIGSDAGAIQVTVAEPLNLLRKN